MLRILNEVTLEYIGLFIVHLFTFTLFGVGIIGTHFINDKIESPLGVVLYTCTPSTQDDQD